MHDAERWHRVEQLFHSALELDPAARAEYLIRECGGDQDLRRRVESLLGRDDATSPIDHPITSEPVSRTFGRYRLLSKLGEGGMGAVYLARDTQLNREVALKVLPPLFAADAERKRRFLREARAASSLSHPNIVPVHDFGQEGDVEYFVMEYIRGKPLDRLIPRTGLKLDEVLDYAIPIASALQAAHEAGIVHRDVKPGNVIVDDRGVPKVLDFGIAKLTEDRSPTDHESTATGEGKVIGTVAYMSPEQAEGRPIDARSDIFSFGSLLYEMVTGRRAFDRGANASTLTAILRDDPPRADSLVQDIPAALSGVLAKCLKKNPADRYQRVSDVLAELERVRKAVVRPSRLVSTPIWYPIAAILLLVGVTAGWWLLRTGLVPLRSVGAPTKVGLEAPDSGYRLIPLTSDPGEEISPSFSPDGNQIAFAHRPLGNVPSHIFIKVVGQSEAVQVTRGADADFDPAWSPDGRWIAFLRYSGLLTRGWPMPHGKWTVMLIPPIGGPERTVAELNYPEFPGSVPWHADSKSIAIVDRGANGFDAIYTLSIEDGTRRQLTTPPAGSKDWNPAFAPDGKSLVFTRVAADWNQDLYTVELTPELTPKGDPRRLTFQNGFVHDPTWAPDGRSVLYMAGSNHSPSLWRVWIQPDAREPKSPQRIAAAGVGVRTPTVSKTGRLAFAQYVIDVDIWRIDLTRSGRGSERVAASTRLDHTVQLSPDGTLVAFASERSGAHEIWVSNADGTNALQLTSFDGPYTADPHWSPDGQWISFTSRPGGNSAIYVMPAHGGAMKRLTDPALRAVGGSWSPDGQWIYCEIEVQLWKLPAKGGSPVRITRNGGGTRAQSGDGVTILYLKNGSEAENSPLWAVPAEGGEEREVLPAVFSHNFVVRTDGIYYIPSPEKPAIWFYRFADRKSSVLATLRTTPAFGMDVSKDGRYALVPEYEDPGADIMMIENFR